MISDEHSTDQTLLKNMRGLNPPPKMPINRLIESGKPLEAWEAIQKLPRQLWFTNGVLLQQLSCAIALGWDRKAAMLAEVLSKSLEPGSREGCAREGCIPSLESRHLHSTVEKARAMRMVSSR